MRNPEWYQVKKVIKREIGYSQAICENFDVGEKERLHHTGCLVSLRMILDLENDKNTLIKN